MLLPPWQDASRCHATMDCDCCGARAARICMEPPHPGTHAYVCRACGKDKDCA